MARRALGRLEAASRLQNQAVGDALANMLLVEAILRSRGWTYARWDRIYTDVPCSHLKVRPSTDGDSRHQSSVQ